MHENGRHRPILIKACYLARMKNSCEPQLWHSEGIRGIAISHNSVDDNERDLESDEPVKSTQTILIGHSRYRMVVEGGGDELTWARVTV